MVRLLRVNRKLQSIALVGLLLGAACATPERKFVSRDHIIASPVGFPSYPLESSDHRIWIEATIEVGFSETLGRSFSDSGVLPVAVTIGTLKKEREQLHLNPEVLNARLYLQDGTTLFWASPRAMQSQKKVLQEAVRKHGLRFTLLKPWETADTGYLFFGTEGTRISENYVLVSRGDFFREVNMQNALLELYVSTPDGPRVVRVGARNKFTGGA